MISVFLCAVHGKYRTARYWDWEWVGMVNRTVHFDRTGSTEKSGPPRKVNRFFENFSGWTEPVHSVLDRNYRKFWLNGSRPNFQLARDQVLLLETAANLWVSRRKANDFFAVFSSFELGGITKQLMTGAKGNSEVLRKQNSLFPLAPVIFIKPFV